MKHKSQEEIERKQQQKIAELTAEYNRLRKQNQAGKQEIAALEELKHISQRMLDLQYEDKEDTPEYHQLEQRYQMLTNFRIHQNLLFEGLGFDSEK